jgi:glutamate N-acetyltransferase/amino-acid N-acetyltransferase
MKSGPLLSILQCLRISEEERRRLLAETEVASQVVAAYFKVSSEDDPSATASVLVDELSEFGELIRITPDPAMGAGSGGPQRDFFVIAIIPTAAGSPFEHLFERPSIERHSSVTWEDRADLAGLFEAMDLPTIRPAEEEDPEELLDRARSFILATGEQPILPSSREPLPTASEEHLSIVTLPKGFRAAGVHCGIKAQKLDLGILVSDCPAASAGRFTLNRFASGPVLLCQEHLAKKDVRAVVVNSGISNAATGERGLADAHRMAEIGAQSLGLEHHQVLVSSTGVIGQFLPMDKIELGILDASERLETGRDERFLQAIMTTDTRMKYAVRRFQLGRNPVCLGGLVKGAGMIHPNMATMLAYLTTDAAIRPSALNQALGIAVQETFNRLSVDGDTSTSDSVILLANGAAGNEEVGVDHPEFYSFVHELRELCLDLVRQLARDGEGATHLVRVVCEAAFNPVDAAEVAKAISTSLLVKTAIFGRDPNWGRIIMAVGNTQAHFDPNRVRVWLAGILLFENGLAAAFDRGEVSRAMGQDEVEIRVNLAAGKASATVYTCDLSYDYVRINAEYHT